MSKAVHSQRTAKKNRSGVGGGQPETTEVKKSNNPLAGDGDEWVSRKEGVEVREARVVCKGQRGGAGGQRVTGRGGAKTLAKKCGIRAWWRRCEGGV